MALPSLARRASVRPHRPRRKETAMFPTLALLIAALGVADPAAPEAAKPPALHPDNPHYFLFRGRPTVLITSGEHYGAVLNLDFDYRTYLKTLEADGLNLT